MPIATEGIIDREWANLLKSWIDGDRYVDYYIERRNTGINIPIEQDDSDRINRQFKWIDSITGLRVRETSDPNNADLFFTQVDAQFFDNPVDEGTLGYTELVTNGSREYFDIVYVDDEVNDYYTAVDGVTINHEIGHGLGLDHPYGDGFNSNFTRDDTIMSYNPGTPGGTTKYQDSDIAALKFLWGEAGTNYDVVANNSATSSSGSGVVDGLTAGPGVIAQLNSIAGSDKVLYYHIDKKGKYNYPRSVAKSEPTKLSRSEYNLANRVYADISNAASGLTLVQTKSPRNADIIVGGVEEATGSRHQKRTISRGKIMSVWSNEKNLSGFEEFDIRAVVGLTVGFGDNSFSPKKTTFTSLYGDYTGLTQADIAALNEIWPA